MLNTNKGRALKLSPYKKREEFVRLKIYRMASNSTSKISVALPGITLPAPRGP